MATRLLPLFPLQVVLLPATPLPLHIFEERYKQMMGEIIPEHGEFGVVLAKENGIVNIGCTAAVERVLRRYPDGRLDLIAVGRRRFTILSLDNELPYLRGEVEYFDDESVEDVAPELRTRAIAAYESLMQVESPEMISEPQMDSPKLSFQLAQVLSDLDKRQAILSVRSETERLRLLVAMMPEYAAERARIAEAKRLAPQNGHAKHIHS
jgi:ATP-dependent Lon protease